MKPKKNAIGFLILILISILSGYCLSFALFSQNDDTYNYFIKICDVPYGYTPEENISPEKFWKNGYGDCNDRAVAFKAYLLSKGEKNVQICKVFRLSADGKWIPSFYKDKSIGHSFVVWNDKVYSPNNNESNRAYGMDIKNYQNFLKTNYGFNMWYYENQTEVIPF